MRALTVQQPWAWAIVHGGKDVENRTQAWKYRGPLAIHAGSRWSERGANDPTMAMALEVFGNPALLAHGVLPQHFERGEIIGVVDLVGAHLAEQQGASVTAWADWCCQPWGEGSYAERHEGTWRQRTNIVHLELDNPRSLPEPIPCKGRLGLWTPPAEVLEQLQAVAR